MDIYLPFAHINKWNKFTDNLSKKILSHILKNINFLCSSQFWKDSMSSCIRVAVAATTTTTTLIFVILLLNRLQSTKEIIILLLTPINLIQSFTFQKLHKRLFIKRHFYGLNKAATIYDKNREHRRITTIIILKAVSNLFFEMNFDKSFEILRWSIRVYILNMNLVKIILEFHCKYLVVLF